MSKPSRSHVTAMSSVLSFPPMGPLGRREEVPPLLDVFCMKEGGAWRVHLGPDFVPPALERLFDRRGEAYPVLLDWEDLERYMEAQGAEYEAHISHAGSVELATRGARATEALANWLTTAISSGIRLGGEDEDAFEPAVG